jgi:hypothetical protein
MMQGSIRKKVALLIMEEEENNSGILETPEAIIEYDILVYHMMNGVTFEKKGTTTKEKLEETLSFEADMETGYSVSLDLTAIINGKRYPFFSVTPNDRLFQNLENYIGAVPKISRDIMVTEPKFPMFDTMEQYYVTDNFRAFIQDYRNTTGIVQGDTPENIALIEQAEKEATAVAFEKWKISEREVELLTIRAEYEAEGHIDIPFYVVRQSVIDKLITDSYPNGKMPVVLTDVITEVNFLETQAKVLERQIAATKKQSLGALFATDEETTILDNFTNEKLYTNLMNLINGYKKAGLSNLSTYRLGVYESLKAATDNLIVLKGKLENINYVPKKSKVKKTY